MSTSGRHAEYETVELAPVPEDLLTGVDDVDLASDPFADDLSAQLAARAPRRYATRTTMVLAALVLLAIGFFAGAQVQKRYGTPAAGSQASGRSAFAAAGGNFGGGNFGGGGFGGQRQVGQTNPGAAQPSAAASNVTTGSVKLVDGTTLYVQTADGNVVTVRTGGTTAIQGTPHGKLSDLTPGTQVTVTGSASGDGVVTATKVAKG